MENNLNINKEKWESKGLTVFSNSKENGYKTIAQCHIQSFNHDKGGRAIPDIIGEEHAKLIAEAGNVANETGLTPRQLLDFKNQLIDAHKESCNQFIVMAEEIVKLREQREELLSNLTAMIDGKERDYNVLSSNARIVIDKVNKNK